MSAVDTSPTVTARENACYDRFRPRIDLLVAVGLYLSALGIYALRTAESLHGPLTGEEASLSFLYVLGIPQRLEYSVYATNFAGHVFFWIASHLDPSLDLFYGRVAKALFMALLAPLSYLVLRRRLGCHPCSALTGAASVALLPGVAVFAWLATENGLEAVWGLAALLVLTSARRWWPLGLVLSGIALSSYSAGLAWVVTAIAVAVVRTLHAPRAAWSVGAAGFAGVAVVLFPRLWWTNGGVLLTGGGALDPSWRRGAELISLLSSDGSSYYYFDDLPLLGAWPLALLGGLAVVLACARRAAAMWPYALLALITVALYIVSGNITGSRRVIALTVVVGLALGVLVDQPSRASLRRAGAVLLATVVLVTSVATALQWGSDPRGARALPIDFPFPTDGSSTQQVVLERLDADLRSGRTTVDLVADRFDVRTLSMLVLLSQRRGVEPPLDAAEVIRVYASTDLCRELDGAACADLVRVGR